MCFFGSGIGQSGGRGPGHAGDGGEQRQGSTALAVVHGAGEHVPDGPPLGQQPPEAVGWRHHSLKAKAST
ncbi:MAG: hypothetical protein VKM34_02185 [Cyanobacteriota bacterium]|nr:hypothetical protein [Cyanobacteriota bacterium]